MIDNSTQMVVGSEAVASAAQAQLKSTSAALARDICIDIYILDDIIIIDIYEC